MSTANSMHRGSTNDPTDAVKLKTARFDTIEIGPLGYAEIQYGYKNLAWSNMLVLDWRSNKDYRGTGYETGVTSGHQVAFTGYREPAAVYLPDGGTFTFNSVEMTSAFDDSQRVNITAYDSANNVIHHRSVDITDAGPTLISLNWEGVSTIVFTPLFGYEVVFDDMVFSKIVVGSAIGPVHQQSILGDGAFAALTGHADAAPVHSDTQHPVHLVLA